MLYKQSSAFAAALALAIGFAVASAAAAPRHDAAHAHAARHHRYAHAHPGYAGPVGPVIAGYAEHGVYFVPGKGIVGEACDLPTSACPNSMRDAQ